MTISDRPTPHGTVNGYRNYGCRCDECRRANADKQRVYMRGHPEQREKHRRRSLIRRGLDPDAVFPVVPVSHGTLSGVRHHRRAKTAMCPLCAAYANAAKVMRQSERTEKLRPCGTLAAVRRHYRRHEPLDDLCRRAMSLHNKARRAKKKQQL